jgi:hypothetical protein
MKKLCREKRLLPLRAEFKKHRGSEKMVDKTPDNS